MSDPFRSDRESLRRAQEELAELKASYDKLWSSTPFMQRFPVPSLLSGGAVLVLGTAILSWLVLGGLHKYDLAAAGSRMEAACNARLADASKDAEQVRQNLETTRRSLDTCMSGRTPGPQSWRAPNPQPIPAGPGADRTEVMLACNEAETKLARCWATDHGTVRLTVTFENSGAIDNVVVKSPQLTGDEFGCVEKVFGKLHITPFAGPTTELTREYKASK